MIIFEIDTLDFKILITKSKLSIGSTASESELSKTPGMKSSTTSQELSPINQQFFIKN